MAAPGNASMAAGMKTFGVGGAALLGNSLLGKTAISAASTKESAVVSKPEDITKEKLVSILSVLIQEQVELRLKVNELVNELATSGEEDFELRQIFEFVSPLLPSDDFAGRFGVKEGAAFARAEALAHGGDEQIMQLGEKLEMARGGIAVDGAEPPPGTVDDAKVAEMDAQKLYDIHVYMREQLKRLFILFHGLPKAERMQMPREAVEKTMEVLVAIQVQRKFGYRSEEVEKAIEAHEEIISTEERFQQINQQVAEYMQHLMMAAKPKVDRDQLIEMLKQLSVVNQKSKAMHKSLAEAYKAGDFDWEKQYGRYIEMQEDAMAATTADVDPMDLRIAYNALKDGDQELQQEWETSGADKMTTGLCFMRGIPPPPIENDPKKPRKQIPPERIVECQELLVESLKGVVASVRKVPEETRRSWNTLMGITLCQTIASAAIDEKYGLSEDELVMHGMQHQMVLSGNSRFRKAIQTHEVTVQLLQKLIGDGSTEAPQQCSVM
mmetsp:Transcript_57184/g.152764  ORF Transcript_57184/g.152764 Transcript_57184/m.152764 type:complete len:496 (-) Transcript_57184:204-1691(-)